MVDFKAGEAYYSRELGCQLLLSRNIPINSTHSTVNLWYYIGSSGAIRVAYDAEVGLDTLEPMVRNVHYVAALKVADKLVKLGLDKIAQEGVYLNEYEDDDS